MTVAVVVKVFDGIVVAADSATTLQLSFGHHVYKGANKVFHLHRKLPLAAMTWDAGQIGDASIATLTKDLRRRLMGMDPDHLDWALNPASYTVEEVVNRYVEMFYGELWSTAGVPPGHALGMLIVGYSAGERKAEAWEVILADPATAPTPELKIPADGYGWLSFAQPEATERLFNGIDPIMAQAIAAAPGDMWPSIEPIAAQFRRQPVHPAMPLADAIEVADFLAGVTAQYSHFLLGPDTVGGVVDIAAISRHEGFRWIRRKHYYSRDLNPWGHDHDQ